MNAPVFTLPTSGTDPKIANKEDLEASVNQVSTALYDRIVSVDDYGISSSILARSAAMDPLFKEEAEVFSRLDYTQSIASINAALRGWRVPFKHNGQDFDTVQFTIRASTDNTNTLVKVYDNNLEELARGYAVCDTSATLLTVYLDKVVSSLGVNAIGYIGYEPVDDGGVLGYPSASGGNNYPAGDADPTVYREQYLSVNDTWVNASSPSNWCIPFRALKLSGTIGLGKFKTIDDRLTGIDGSIDNLLALSVGATLVSFDLLGFTEGNTSYLADGAGVKIEAQTADISFNNLVVYGACNGAGKMRGYLLDPSVSSSHVPATSGTLLFEHDINWTTTIDERVESLASIYKVPAGKELHILWVCNSPSDVAVKAWSENTSGDLSRIRFCLTEVGNETGIWSETWYDGSTTLYGVPPKLLLSGSVDGDVAEPLAVPEFALPDVVNAVVGSELLLQYDGIVSAHSSGLSGLSGYSCTITGPKGKNWERFFQFTPVSGDVGSHDFVASLFDGAGNIVVSKEFEINVVSATAKGSAKNVLMVGDSLTSPGTMTSQARAGFEALTGGVVPTFVGSQGVSPNNHEGYGGRRFTDFATDGGIGYRATVSGVTAIGLNSVYSTGGVNYFVREINITGGAGDILLSGPSQPANSGTLTFVSGSGDATVAYSAIEVDPANPFWNISTSQLDIANYRADIGLTTLIDAVIFQLDINGLVATSIVSTANIQARIDAAKLLVDAFLADNSSCKIIMGLPSICGNTSNGFASNYGAVYSREIYETNIAKMRKALITAFDGGAYHANVSIGASGLSVDRYYGYTLSSVAVSDLITDTHLIHTNAVHPAVAGSHQMGNQHFADLMANLN